jgi:hypothetical protein
MGAVRTIGGAALVGAASGLRSTSGIGAIIWRGGPRMVGAFRHPAARSAAATAVGVEMVLDKMPFTGSRLEPPGLIGRVAFAGVAAGLLARAGMATRQEAAANAVIPLAMATAGAAALVAAKAGHDWRAALAEDYPDAIVAVGEDVLAVTLAGAGMALADGR